MLRSTTRFIIVALLGGILIACGSPEERSAAYLEKAQQLFDEGDYTTARIEALNAAQIEPRNAEVRYLLAEIEEEEQNFRQAIGHLQVAVDAEETHLPSRLKLGNYYILAKAVDLADEQTTAAEGIEPANAEVILLRARVMYLQEDADGAEAQVEKALAADPKLVDATMFKAGLSVTRQEYDEALRLVDGAVDVADGEDLQRLRQFRIILLRTAGRNDEVESELKSLIADYPDEESYAVTLAQLYIADEKTDEAEEILRKIVYAEPEDAQRRIDFVRFVLRQRGPEEAEAVFTEFVEELPDSQELKLAQGRFYESQEDPEKAYAIYEGVAASDPTSETGLLARNRMVAIKVRDNELDEARQMLADILEVEPDNSEALLVRSAFSFTERDYDASVADLRTVLRSDETSTRALLLLARSHVGAGSLELAQDAYRRLIEVEPNHPTASNELADLLARTGDADQAEEVLRRKLELAPDDRRSASNLVEALLMQGETDAAEEEARILVEMDDPSGLGEFQLGRVMQAQQSQEEAIEAYKQALEKNPQAIRALQGLTGALVQANRADEAIGHLNDYIENNPDQESAVRLMIGTVYAGQKDTVAAAAEFEKVIELNPEANRAYASLAALYPDDAAARIEIYQRGFAANPTDSTLGLLLAGEYERSQNWQQAIGLYESLMETDAANDIVVNNLAALLLDQSTNDADHQRALEMAKRFADSNQPALVDTLGWAYYRNGDYPSAVRYLEVATRGGERIAVLRYHLGMAYWKNQNPVGARAELEQALELAQDFVGIDEARATLEELQAGA